MFRFLLIGLLTSCGHGKKDSVPTRNPIDAIIEKSEHYMSKIAEVQDAYGFIHSDTCDSVLFSGLINVAGAKVDLLAARDDKTGQWFRTPYKDCYSNFGASNGAARQSRSTISRDMFAGIFYSLYRSGNLVELERIRKYGQDHDWIMGQGTLDRVYMTPNLVETLYGLLGKKYSGPPYLWLDPGKDHQRHVVALNIILRGESVGSIPKEALSLLKGFLAAEPNNALFSYGVHRYTDGDQSTAIGVLLNEELFPSDMPAMRCRRWLWEREESSWSNCDHKELSTGGDLIFLSHLLTWSSR